MKPQRVMVPIRLKKSPSVFAGGLLAWFSLYTGFHFDRLTEFQLSQCGLLWFFLAWGKVWDFMHRSRSLQEF
jgi:hypothetical protein